MSRIMLEIMDFWFLGHFHPDVKIQPPFSGDVHSRSLGFRNV